MNWYLLLLQILRYYCIVTTRIIIAFINSSLYSYETYTQVKEMVNLNLFIDSHYKYIVSIIRVKHILTLHLSTANWRISSLLAAAARMWLLLYCSCYAISFCLVESIPQFHELWLLSMHREWDLILLYFKEMLPRTVSTTSLPKSILCLLPVDCVESTNGKLGQFTKGNMLYMANLVNISWVNCLNKNFASIFLLWRINILIKYSGMRFWELFYFRNFNLFWVLFSNVLAANFPNMELCLQPVC